MPSSLPVPRRIVTANLPLPENVAALKYPEPEVQVLCEDVVQQPELDGKAYRGTVFTHEKIPANNDGIDFGVKEIETHGIVLPAGANIRYNDVAPGQTIPMHRTSSSDYNIMLSGEVYLLTPSKAGDGENLTDIKETLCKPGDVVFQRGTLHAWENRSSEWVRWIVVILGADPTMVEIAGQNKKRPLLDFFGQYGGDDIWKDLEVKN